MSDFTFLYPILLLLLPVAVLLVVLPAFRLSAFSRVRRTLAIILQALSAALLVVALAQPYWLAAVRADVSLNAHSNDITTTFYQFISLYMLHRSLETAVGAPIWYW